MVKYRKPYRLKRRKSIFRNRFFWLGILILIISGGVFYLICFYSFFQVKVIEISGYPASALTEAEKQKVLSDEIQKKVDEKINQKVLFFPSRSIFLVNFREIKKEISKSFPQVEEADLKRSFPDRILVQIKERKPVAVLSYADKNFLIDEKGIIFEEVSESEKKQNFTVLKKEMNEEINLGEKVVTEERLSKILEVEAKLKNGLKILSGEILVVSEERFNVKTSEGWQAYFSFQEDLDWQLKKLTAVLGEEIPQEKREDLEYIDVRFGNFAPYKYRD